MEEDDDDDDDNFVTTQRDGLCKKIHFLSYLALFFLE
jgi:hypothetical protein